MKIVVKLSSGLGNQLFMYAFYRHLESRYSVRPSFDDKYFKGDNLRKPELALLFPDYPVWRLPFNPAGEHHLKLRLYNWIQRCNPLVMRISEESYDDRCRYQGHTLYFDGYWQTHRYVDEMDKKLLQPQQPMPVVLQPWLQKIEQAPCAVSLHVRRGDYFTPQYIGRFGVCHEDYYHQAMAYIEQQVGCKVTYFVFSDDPEWVRAHITFQQPYALVDNHDVNSYWYIYLMSRCRHHIISNSTFSWWGAYLNTASDKIVVGPDPWTRDSDTTLMLDEWTKIPVK